MVKAAKDGARSRLPRAVRPCRPPPPQLTSARARALGVADKAARLKQAAKEAEEEISAYKNNRELQFREFAKVRTGDSSGAAKAVEQDTAAELGQIKAQVATNKEKMLAALLQSVTTVSL